MGKLSVGEVVFVKFPYSNFKKFKLRPAVVCAIADFDDLILCQITSRFHDGIHSLKLNKSDFETGELIKESYIRYNKLFSVEMSEVGKKVGLLKSAKIDDLLARLRGLFVYEK